MLDERLKPCPFCNGDAQIVGDLYCYVECTDCGVNFSHDHEYEGDEDAAIEKWNSRSIESHNESLIQSLLSSVKMSNETVAELSHLISNPSVRNSVERKVKDIHKLLELVESGSYSNEKD